MSPKNSIRLALISGMVCLTSAPSMFAGDQLVFDNGDRILVPFSWKIEHKQRSVGEFLIINLNTGEGRKILAAAAMALGVDPATATIVASNLPLPKLDYGATDNKGIISSPAGMTICSAKPVGRLEASRAAWSSSIVRDEKRNGLAYYTSVGTGGGNTHRVMGNFVVEFVKPVANWETKYNCQPVGAVWNIKDTYYP